MTPVETQVQPEEKPQDIVHSPSIWHLRLVDEEGNVANNGGATVAYVQLDELTVRVAVAFCSVQDNFCRKVGRTVAIGRLASAKAVDLHIAVEELKEILEDCDRVYEGQEEFMLELCSNIGMEAPARYRH